MALRKASVYKRIERSYTRTSRVKSKNFIKVVPPKHITKFQMGDVSKYNKNGFNYIVKMLAGEGMQLRDNAIESARQLIVRHMESKIGTDFYLRVCMYPHHIIREHKMAAVAQSDRVFAGMSHAFGKSISVAAQIPEGKEIFVIAVSNESNIPIIRDIYHMAKSKIGSDIKVVVEKVKK